MAVFSLLAVHFIMKTIAVLFVVCSVALVLIVLIQKGRGGGLSGALAGGMAGGILGSKTGDFLTWVTIVLVGVFLLFAVVMAKFYKPVISDFDTGQAQRRVLPARQAEGPEQPSVPSAAGERAADINLPGG